MLKLTPSNHPAQLEDSKLSKRFCSRVTRASGHLDCKRLPGRMACTFRTLLGAAVLVASGWFAQSLQAQTVYVLTADGKLASAPLSNTAAVSTPITIQGVAAGETLVSIDVRPQNQQLYALGVNPVASSATLYHISPETGFAAVVGAAGSIAFSTDGSNQLIFPNPNAVGWDIDFNPAADRLRVVAGSVNFRVNPSTGAGVDGDNGGAAGSVTGINSDGPINTATTTVNGAAYTNNQPNNGNLTTLYTLDGATNSLFIQNPPNAGTQTQGLAITLNGSPLDFTSFTGFDVVPGVNAPSPNAAVTSGSAVALLTVGGTTGLYTINLVNGAATFRGSMPNARSIAVRTELGAAIGLTSDGTALVRFNTSTPDAITTQALNLANVAAGEILVAIDSRPQTGQFYALGVNAAANTATLYLLDPQTGAVFAVGTTGQIQFTTDGATPVDLPDPATAGYGMDFNPTVDRVRVVTTIGLNFRVNPNNGAPVDGNNGNLTAVSGTNPDGSINGNGVTGVAATAYTNSFAQSLTGGVTTQYTLDPVTNSLYIQSPPNNGTQTLPLPLTLGGAPLDFTSNVAFDIPSSVAVPTSNTSATGDGWFVATVGGLTKLYRLDLKTGAAIEVEKVGFGTTSLTGLAVFTTPVVGVEFPAGTPLADSQATIAYGDVTVGQTASQIVKLTNTGSQTLNYSLSIPSNQFAVVGPVDGSLAPGASTNVTVQYSPTISGAASTAFSVISNDSAIASFDIALTGKGLFPLANDAVTVTSGDTRLYVLANDELSDTAVITSVSDPSIIIDGRTLIIPSTFVGNFTYQTLDDGRLGSGVVTVTAGTPVTDATTFNGLLYASGSEIAGFATAKLSASGIATLRIIGGTAKASAKISVPSPGSTGTSFTALGNVTLVRNPNGVLFVSIEALGGSISGSLKPLKREDTATKYHVTLASPTSAIPGGGYAIATVSKKAGVRVIGVLPDGLSFSTTSGIQDNGTIGFYTPVAKGAKPPAFIGGELVPANLAATDITGELAWAKLPQLAKVKGLHLDGVDTTLNVNGSLYSGEVALPSGAGTLVLSGGNLSPNESNPVTLEDGAPTVPVGSLVSWTGVNQRVGKFSAKITVPGITKPVRGSGIYLPKSNRAWGFFPGTTAGGRIELVGP